MTTTFFIHPEGQVQFVYDEKLDLRDLGPYSIERASHVEPDERGYWWITFPNQERIGPFEKRSQAIEREILEVKKRISQSSSRKKDAMKNEF